MKYKQPIIFNYLKPEYNNRVKTNKKPNIGKQLLTEKNGLETKNKFMQSMCARQRRLEKLLLIENPTPSQEKSIRKIKRRIANMSGFSTPKKYKNKVVKRLKKLKCPRDYSLYIKSEFWTQRKNQYYQVHTKMCMRCGTKKYINLHHKFYNKSEFGQEPDEHLCPLCETCHKIFHSRYGTHTNMIKETDEFLLAVD